LYDVVVMDDGNRPDSFFIQMFLWQRTEELRLRTIRDGSARNSPAGGLG
jgi:hypothetical protein